MKRQKLLDFKSNGIQGISVYSYYYVLLLNRMEFCDILITVFIKHSNNEKVKSLTATHPDLSLVAAAANYASDTLVAHVVRPILDENVR